MRSEHRCADYAAAVAETKNACRILVAKHHGKYSFEKQRRKRKDNIYLSHRKVGCQTRRRMEDGTRTVSSDGFCSFRLCSLRSAATVQCFFFVR